MRKERVDARSGLCGGCLMGENYFWLGTIGSLDGFELSLARTRLSHVISNLPSRAKP